jgi:hypothetical protein
VSNSSKQVLFKVKKGVDGHEYIIYTNGDVEGFGEGALVFNYYPSLIRELHAHQSDPQEDSPRPSLEVRM